MQLEMSAFKDPDKARTFISKMPNSSPNPIFDHLLESPHRGDSNKWSKIGFGEKIIQIGSIEVHLRTLSGALRIPLRVPFSPTQPVFFGTD